MLIEIIGIKENDKILDVGCGVGNITFNMAVKSQKGKVVCIDHSPSMIENCKEIKNNIELNNVDLFILSALDAGYKDEFIMELQNLETNEGLSLKFERIIVCTEVSK